jgi:hypothetical protein
MSKGKWAFKPAALTRAIKAAEKAGKIVTGSRICSTTGDLMLSYAESGAADVGTNEWDGLINDGASRAIR